MVELPFNAKVTLQPFVYQTDMRVEASQISIILQNKTVPLRTTKLRHHHIIKKNKKQIPESSLESSQKMFGKVKIYCIFIHLLHTVCAQSRKKKEENHSCSFPDDHKSSSASNLFPAHIHTQFRKWATSPREAVAQQRAWLCVIPHCDQCS